jgi:hypothetical protein
MQSKPSLEIVKSILQEDLSNCDSEQLAVYRKYSVEPYLAPLVRYGNRDEAVVVARRGNEVIYWEDVEEGFNVSPLAADGTILQHWCNQDELPRALNAWIPGRDTPSKLKPHD